MSEVKKLASDPQRDIAAIVRTFLAMQGTNQIPKFAVFRACATSMLAVIQESENEQLLRAQVSSLLHWDDEINFGEGPLAQLLLPVVEKWPNFTSFQLVRLADLVLDIYQNKVHDCHPAVIQMYRITIPTVKVCNAFRVCAEEPRNWRKVMNIYIASTCAEAVEGASELANADETS